VGTLGELGSSEHSSPEQSTESSAQRRYLGRPSEARPGRNGGAKGEREEDVVAGSGTEAVSADEIWQHGLAHAEACRVPKDGWLPAVADPFARCTSTRDVAFLIDGSDFGGRAAGVPSPVAASRGAPALEPDVSTKVIRLHEA
jgi:hypothetical protein